MSNVAIYRMYVVLNFNFNSLQKASKVLELSEALNSKGSGPSEEVNFFFDNFLKIILRAIYDTDLSRTIMGSLIADVFQFSSAIAKLLCLEVRLGTRLHLHSTWSFSLIYLIS